ncbi:O-antigen ligase family protein [Thermocrispum municipale]|uniref:O-antigen ligase family protein n=1 Tax=Thermocrispum municipale TaxID=37926 RepID=UPI0003FBE47C|nr:membrane protein [Thermocrispum municipale]
MTVTQDRPELAPVRAGVPRSLGAVWALLIVNTLGSQGAETIVPLPRTVTQMITMGAVGLAFVIALVLNPRLKVRPSAYLVILTLLAAVSIAASMPLESGWGGLFRCARLTGFVATLWLISRWWDGSLTFVRYHVRVLMVVVASVVIGLLISPGHAMPEYYDGRLVGAIWPLTAPQVGQYAAVLTGLVLILWLSKLTPGNVALFVSVPAIAVLLLTHTRTAAFGLVAGLTVALLSSLLTNPRARKVFTVGAITAGVGTVIFLPVLQAWVLRGQDQDDFGTLTGRAKVWDALLSEPRTLYQELFGTGLSDKSFTGLPIDNSWLAAYHEQGLIGASLVALFLITLLVVAVARPPSPQRACALFLIAYCLVASYTEAGLADASPYLLHLTVAAALLVTPTTRTVASKTGGAS